VRAILAADRHSTGGGHIAVDGMVVGGEPAMLAAGFLIESSVEWAIFFIACIFGVGGRAFCRLLPDVGTLVAARGARMG